MREVIILGHGGFGRELADWVDQSPDLRCTGFIDIVEPKTNLSFPFLGNDSFLDKYTDIKPNVVLGIGHPEIKYRIYNKLKDKCIFVNVIHPSVILGSQVTIGPDTGVVITPGNILTTNISIGPLSMINLSCTIGHDCTIGSYCTLSPGVNLSGGCKLEDGAYVGTGATVVENKNIGSWSTIGGQAMVVKDVKPNSTVVGIPAKEIKIREPGWYK